MRPGQVYARPKPHEEVLSQRAVIEGLRSILTNPTIDEEGKNILVEAIRLITEK